jgi:hypothetical protein
MPSTQPLESFEKIVFVDILDPDNIFMILYVLAVFKGRVAIVLSPRIVGLSVARYGKEFSEIKKKLGFKFMFNSITEGEKPKIPKKWKKFFQPDGTLSNPEVESDTRLYVRVSKMRIEECIEELFPECEDYEIIWDPESMSKIKKPDMRHALHVADYAFNFNDNERKKYKKIVKKHTKSGPELRCDLYDICTEYIMRRVKETGYSPWPINIGRLFEANETVENANLIIGGPLTEALLYIQKTKGPPKSVYMGGVQFNVGKDPESANDFLKQINEKWIPTFLVPTECCKGKDEKDPCPYALDLEQYREILENRSPLLCEMVLRWMEVTEQEASYNAFDWITAVAATNRAIFKHWVPVTHKPCLSRGSVTNVDFDRAKQGSPIFMAKPDYKYMSKKTKEVRKEMRRGFPKKEAHPLRTEDG